MKKECSLSTFHSFKYLAQLALLPDQPTVANVRTNSWQLFSLSFLFSFLVFTSECYVLCKLNEVLATVKDMPFSPFTLAVCVTGFNFFSCILCTLCILYPSEYGEALQAALAKHLIRKMKKKIIKLKQKMHQKEILRSISYLDSATTVSLAVSAVSATSHELPNVEYAQRK